MNWDELAAGIECPFDRPRADSNEYWDTVLSLGVSTLCLLKNQAYRGHCILIYDSVHVVRPDQLSSTDWLSFSRDLHVTVSALMEVCAADHINVECLGNQVPHLHWQVIPRYRGDPRWGGPIWTSAMEELHDFRLPEAERQELLADIRAALNEAKSD